MLPQPDQDALAHSAALSQVIANEVTAAGGRLPFERYMALALYAPGLGYYSGPSIKFGEGGDFVTAPGIGRLFGQCLARCIGPAVNAINDATVVEFGAGDGSLAVTLLDSLAALDALPSRYLIVETSADLAHRQREQIDALDLGREVSVGWAASLPDRIRGVVIGNELIDAMPVQRFRVNEAGRAMAVEVALERGSSAPVFVEHPGEGEVMLPDGLALPPGYTSEVNRQGPAWLRSVGERLETGLILLADYGFPAAEYYHEDRSQGTLMCHYRHHSHPDPFLWPGLQDITAHVDFTALARAGVDAGLDLVGYIDQANFLIDCGLADILAASHRVAPPGSAEALALSTEVKKLTMPHEMGELFKVIAFASRLPETPRGFARANRCARLLPG